MKRIEYPRIALMVIFGLTGIALGAVDAASAQTIPPSKLTNAADSYQLYGHCRSEHSAMKNKLEALDELGETEAGVISTQVLACRPYTGGAIRKVDCDSAGAGGVPYAYCLDHPNDGLENEKVMGVLKRDEITDVNGLYTGCPGGASLQPKLDVVRSAGVDPRRIKGLVTISCGAAESATRADPSNHACPEEPHPYSRCIKTQNDGHGNAVTLGIVASTDGGDLYGLFGECNGAGSGIRPGFTYKIDVLADVGKTGEAVRAMDVLVCADPAAFGSGIPEKFKIFDGCQLSGLPQALTGRYDYCVWGIDKNGNGVLFGVSGGAQV